MKAWMPLPPSALAIAARIRTSLGSVAGAAAGGAAACGAAADDAIAATPCLLGAGGAALLAACAEGIGDSGRQLLCRAWRCAGGAAGQAAAVPRAPRTLLVAGLNSAWCLERWTSPRRWNREVQEAAKLIPRVDQPA